MSLGGGVGDRDVFTLVTQWAVHVCLCVKGKGGGVVLVSKKSVLLNFAIHHLCRRCVDVVNFGPVC